MLRRTLTYLQNRESRMDYATYRQQGLPVTSSMVESLIKEVSYRVANAATLPRLAALIRQRAAGGCHAGIAEAVSA